eukprot:NODE_925_length_3060_cov_0.339412.p3 type:complete len:139 gc:universal NODE_925_length_3060_cov_0.339412:1704-1288(-)
MQLIFKKQFSSSLFLQLAFILAIVSSILRNMLSSSYSLACIDIPLNGGIKICGNKVFKTGYQQDLEYIVDSVSNFTINGNFIEISSSSDFTVLKSLKYKKNVEILNDAQINEYLLNRAKATKKIDYPWYYTAPKYRVN